MTVEELNKKKENLLLRLKTLDLSENDLEKCLSKCNSVITTITNKCKKAKDANFTKIALKEKLKIWINSLTLKTDVCAPFQYEDSNELYRSDGKIFIIILEEACKSFVDRHFWKTLYESNENKLKSIAEFINVLSISVTDFENNVINKADSVFDVAIQLYKKENEDNLFNDDMFSDYESISYEINNNMSDSIDEINTSDSDEICDISFNKENKTTNNQTNIGRLEKTFENKSEHEISIPCNNESDLLIETETKSITEMIQLDRNFLEENLNVYKERLEIYERWTDELLELLKDCKERNNLSLKLFESDKLQNIMILCKYLCALIDKVKTNTLSISYLEEDISSIEDERCSFVDNDFVIHDEYDITFKSKTIRGKKTKKRERSHIKQNINTEITKDFINESNRSGKERVVENIGNTILRKISMNENYFNKSIKNYDSTDSEYFDHEIQTRMKKAVESRKCINEKMNKVIKLKKLSDENAKITEKTSTEPEGRKEDNQNKKIKKYKRLNKCCI